MADLKKHGAFDPKTGQWKLPDGTPIDFLPELPSNSLQLELVVTDEKAPLPASDKHADGHVHIPLGSDEATIDAVIAFYEAAGHPVPDGFKDETLHHAARAAAVARGEADPG